MDTNYEYPVITLVGSTRFPDVWIAAQRHLTLAGCIVHTVGLFGHCENLDMSGPTKKMLDRMYLRKIELSHGILVLNKDGYIGLGAMDEISFALANAKLVSFLEPLDNGAANDMFALASKENSEYTAHPLPLTLKHLFVQSRGWSQTGYLAKRAMTAINAMKI